MSNPNHAGYKRAIAMKVCPFNSTHHVHKSDMELHLTECNDALLQRESNKVYETERMNLKLNILDEVVRTEIQTPSIDNEEEEDWEKEIEGLNLNSYDLMKKSTKRDLRYSQRIGDVDTLSQIIDANAKNKPNEAKVALPIGMCITEQVKKKKKKKKGTSYIGCP